MKIKLFILLAICTMLFAVKTTLSQEGRYSVGKTACTIEWSQDSRAYKVYWDEGTGFTLLFYADTYPNGNVVLHETETDGVTMTGTFTFKSDSYRSGEYERYVDGKMFSVKRR